MGVSAKRYGVFLVKQWFWPTFCPCQSSPKQLLHPLKPVPPLSRSGVRERDHGVLATWGGLPRHFITPTNIIAGSNVSSKSYLSHELSKKRSPKKTNKMNLGLPRLVRPRFIKWKQQNDHTCCQKNKIIPQQQRHDGSFSAEDLPKPIAVVEKISNNSKVPSLPLYKSLLQTGLYYPVIHGQY